MISRLLRSLVISAFVLQLCSSLNAQNPTSVVSPAQDQRPRLSIQLGHNSFIRAAAYSPSGQFLATMGSDNTLLLWDAESGVQIKEFKQPTDLFALAFSPDGKFILTGGGRYERNEARDELVGTHRNAYAILWDVATGKRVQQYDVQRVTSVAFSPDGRLVLIGDIVGVKSKARLFDTQTAKEVRVFEPKPATLLVEARVSPDGRSIFASGWDALVHMWDATTGVELRTFGTAVRNVFGVIPMALSADGHFLLTGGTDPRTPLQPDNIARLWDTASGEKVREFKHPSRVFSLAWLPDGKRFISGSGPPDLRETEVANIHVWDITTGQELRHFKRRAVAKRIALSPNGEQFVALADGDSVANSWHTGDGEPKQRFEGYSSQVNSVAFSPNSHFILSGMGAVFSAIGDEIDISQFNYSGHLWNVDSGQQVYELKHRSSVNTVAFTTDSRFALTASGFGERAAHLWDVNTGQKVKSFVEQFAVSRGAISGDGRSIIGVSPDPRPGGKATVHLWDVDSERKLRTFEHVPDSDIHSLAFSPDGRYIATGTGSFTSNQSVGAGFARLWDVSTGKELFKVTHPTTVSSLAFSPDGRTFASGCADSTARLWDVATGKKLRSFDGRRNGVLSTASTDVAFSPDGRYLLTGISPVEYGPEEPFVRLWEVDTGKLLREFKHPAPVWSVAFSGDGKFVLTGSQDSTTRVWKTSTAEELCRMISFRDGTWVIVDAEGRFDTNNLEEIRGLRWIMADEPLRPRPLEIFMRDYYQPRLLPRLLNGEELTPVRPLVNINRVQPVVNITSIIQQPNQPGLVTVTVEVSKAADKFDVGGREVTRETGIYDVRLFRDRQIVGESPAPIDSPSKAGRPAQSSELEAWRQSSKVQLDRSGRQTIKFQNVQLPRRTGIEQVEFSAYAFNDDRVKSLTARKSFVLPQPIPPVKRRAYVITVGVSAYENKAWDLRFAAKDATLVSQVLTGSLAQAGDYAEIVPLSLTSDYRAQDKQAIQTTATKANFKEVLALLSGALLAPRLLKDIPNAAKLKKATPDDLVLIFFSSHGLYRKVGGRDSFYFLPYDIGAGDRMVETPSLFARSISNEELASWLREVDAGEMILIANACQSEASVNTEGFKPGPLGNRSLGQLAYDKGMRILAASQALSSALEADELSASLLTRALITDGLQAHEADYQPRDQKITLSEWLKFGEQRVPKLYEEAKYAESRIQRPVLFDFVRTSRETKLADAPK